MNPRCERCFSADDSAHESMASKWRQLFSGLKQAGSGVPRGSVLRSRLLLIDINDIHIEQIGYCKVIKSSGGTGKSPAERARALRGIFLD